MKRSPPNTNMLRLVRVTSAMTMMMLLVLLLMLLDAVHPQEQQQQQDIGLTCSDGFREYCSACFINDGEQQFQQPNIEGQQSDQQQERPTQSHYDCSLPGLEDFIPGGQYEGITVNYLSFVTTTSSPNFPIRAAEFYNCTGGKILFSEAANVWEDPIQDLGTKSVRGSEVYDGYFMSYSHFPEASKLNLAEHLNERIRNSNNKLKWEDLLPKVRKMGEYRQNGVTNIDFLMYDGDFFLPIIRLDLLQKHNLPIPNTWDEVVSYAKYFNGTDLNDDGIPDYGFCHFPRDGAGYWDWWASEVLYAIWATYDQTHGMQQGFFFNEDTMEPRIQHLNNNNHTDGFKKATQIWKELWLHGSDAISPDMITGRCAIGFGPPGGWKAVILDKDGISRKDPTNGTVIWRPTYLNGDIASEPYRFKPFGTIEVYDRISQKLVNCTPELCPKAEPIPSSGHISATDKASRLNLPSSPYEGMLINRAPFYWSGGLGTLIRKSSSEQKKDLMWDFFVYTNSPDTSIHDVANYPSWLDSWRYSQLLPGDNFYNAGWSQTAYEEHVSIMTWALSNEVNGAMNLRVPGAAKYTRDKVGSQMTKYIANEITIDEFCRSVALGWEEVTLQQGKLDQLEIYRAGLGLDAHSEVDLCRLHRDLVDKRDPSICRKYDPVIVLSSSSSSVASKLAAIVTPSVCVIFALIVVIILVRKRKLADSLWEIDPKELHFAKPPEVLGRGTFGFVVLAEYRGTQVAVKRVIPPKKKTTSGSGSRGNKRQNRLFGAGDPQEMGFRSASVQQSCENMTVDRLASTSSKGSKGSQNSSKAGHGTNEASDTDIEGNKAISTAGTNDKAKRPLTFDSGSYWRVSFLRRPKDNSSLKARKEYTKLKANFVIEMRRLSKLRHPSITTVMGAVVRNNQEPMLVMECMDHGSLYDILHNDTIPLEGDLILPILKDIAQGVRFLHSSTPQVIHGDLKAQNVLIDSRFRAKVTDFGLSAKRHVGNSTGWLSNQFRNSYRNMNFSSWSGGGWQATGTPFWMAPELLRGESPCTDASDVYSFGIILYEVYSRKDPYEGEDPYLVLQEVADKNIQRRPPVPEGCPTSVASLMTDCLNGDGEFRPTFQEIDRRLNRLNSKNAEPSDRKLSKGTRRMIRASRNEDLLSEIFPGDIADALRGGRKVEPQRKEIVTIYFSDIVGYTNICTELTPEKVSDLLDRLYTQFDNLSHLFGVHKMETIGDAYMGVTNLVESQDDDHVSRIANFSFEAIEAASRTLIDIDKPEMGSVQLRSGFHSGPVIARVVGTRNPKYAVFGDTVNTASRMESHSLPGRVHCSARSADLLREQCPELYLASRGDIHVKGKGMMHTYFVSTQPLHEIASYTMNTIGEEQSASEGDDDFSCDSDSEVYEA